MRGCILDNRHQQFNRRASNIGQGLHSNYEQSTEEDLPLVVRQPRVNTPALVILLGSTAALSALELMRHMLTLQQQDQRKVAFVYIDTDEPSSSVVEFRQYHNGVFQEFPLRIAVPVRISHVDRIKQESGNGSLDPTEPHTFIKDKVPQYFANGAGGIRNNGHVAACFHQKDIYDTLDRALASITSISHHQNARRQNEVRAYIVTFLGGGTGSGILPDLAVMVRDLLSQSQYEQRINLFCMLPETVKGASLNDLSWRRSNTLACILELLAYSLGAGASPNSRYKKYMREKIYTLTKDPIANEVFLLGQTLMDDPTNAARLVGLDLFQRIANASGVGYLEYSKQVDRRTLGESDDQGLPTMFGTSCPLEVRFPAEETALAFAQLSAANLLPLLADYRQIPVMLDDRQKQELIRTWREVAPINANPSAHGAVPHGQIGLDEFLEAEQEQLNSLWSKVQRFEEETTQRLRDVMTQKYRSEQQRVNLTPRMGIQGETSMLNARGHHLQTLREQYTIVLEYLCEQRLPALFPRPVELEAELIQPGGVRWLPFRSTTVDQAREVFNSYNDHMRLHAHVTRHQLLKQALQDLLQLVDEKLEVVRTWFNDTDVEEHIHELESKGLSSAAWQGLLDYPHPHQRHIFDLGSLRHNGQNLATERFYIWATGGKQILNNQKTLKDCYLDYVEDCMRFLDHKMSDPSANSELGRLEDHNAGRLAESIVSFFKEIYVRKFQNMNLFEVLEEAAPLSRKPRTQQISGYLFEHLQHMHRLMGDLLVFEPELWEKGRENMDTSLYLGIHTRDGSGQQKEMLRLALDSLGALTRYGQQPTVQDSFDPHRLQTSYGHHAISITTVQDFYLDQNSSMEAYEYHQSRWEGGSNSLQGFMPTHSCQEAQRLVRESNALGRNSHLPLYKRLLRRPGGR